MKKTNIVLIAFMLCLSSHAEPFIADWNISEVHRLPRKIALESVEKQTFNIFKQGLIVNQRISDPNLKPISFQRNRIQLRANKKILNPEWGNAFVRVHEIRGNLPYQYFLTVTVRDQEKLMLYMDQDRIIFITDMYGARFFPSAPINVSLSSGQTDKPGFGPGQDEPDILDPKRPILKMLVVHIKVYICDDGWKRTRKLNIDGQNLLQGNDSQRVICKKLEIDDNGGFVLRDKKLDQ